MTAPLAVRKFPLQAPSDAGAIPVALLQAVVVVPGQANMSPDIICRNLYCTGLAQLMCVLKH